MHLSFTDTGMVCALESAIWQRLSAIKAELELELSTPNHYR